MLAFFLGITSYFLVERETGSVLCRTALWDCFGNAIASFILLLELRGKRTGSKTVTKSSPTEQRTNFDTFRASSIDRIAE